MQTPSLVIHLPASGPSSCELHRKKAAARVARSLQSPVGPCTRRELELKPLERPSCPKAALSPFLDDADRRAMRQVSRALYAVYKDEPVNQWMQRIMAGLQVVADYDLHALGRSPQDVAHVFDTSSMVRLGWWEAAEKRAAQALAAGEEMGAREYAMDAAWCPLERGRPEAVLESRAVFACSYKSEIGALASVLRGHALEAGFINWVGGGNSSLQRVVQSMISDLDNNHDEAVRELDALAALDRLMDIDAAVALRAYAFMGERKGALKWLARCVKEDVGLCRQGFTPRTYAVGFLLSAWAQRLAGVREVDRLIAWAEAFRDRAFAGENPAAARAAPLPPAKPAAGPAGSR